MDYVANLCFLLPHCSSLTDTLFNKNCRSLEYLVLFIMDATRSYYIPINMLSFDLVEKDDIL